MQNTSPLEVFMNENPRLNKKMAEAFKVKMLFFLMIAIVPLIFGGLWDESDLFFLSVMGPLVLTFFIFLVSVVHFETMRKEKMNDYFLMFVNMLLISMLVFMCFVTQTVGQIINIVLIISFAVTALTLSVRMVRDWFWGSAI